MKTRSFLLLSPLVSVVLYFTLTSYSSGISGAYSGGCTCHDATSSSATVISLTGLPSGGYQNGTVYTLTLTVTNTLVSGPNPRDGFDLNASDGEFSPTSETQLFSPNEIGHNAPKQATGGTVIWTFDWTAPLTGNMPVTFNLSANATNGDGVNGPGDFWNTFNTTIVNANGSPSTVLNLKLFLEGYYVGGSTMTPVLMNQGIGSNASITDSIQVELKDPFDFSTTLSTSTLLLTDGTASCDFGPTSGAYYIAINHRNGILSWSASPVSIVPGYNMYDFSSDASQTYGNNMIEVETGIWAFYVGDLVKDENIDLLDLGAVENDINTFQYGYFATDLNGDGNVDLLDTPILESNVSNFVFSNHP